MFQQKNKGKFMKEEYLLVLNVGSSSLKYGVYDNSMITLKPLVGENIKNIGVPGSKTQNHSHAFEQMNNNIQQYADKIIGVGHRVVLGGEKFKSSVKINDDVKNAIDEMSDIAPLHNKPALQSINKAQEIFPNAIHAAAFDTAFHQTIPQINYTYAIPYDLSEKYGIRKFGFHGTSVRFVVASAANMLNKNPNQCNLIVCHIGSGTSITAIKNGQSINNSMGFMPNGGPLMGTRTGDIDPMVIFYLMEKENMSVDQAKNMINKNSGIQGLAGTSDFYVIEQGYKENEKAKLVWDTVTKQIAEYIASYMMLLDYKIDAIIFTGGGGENSAPLREDICNKFKNFGIRLDKKQNSVRGDTPNKISNKNSSVQVLRIPTNEEFVIANDTATIIKSKQPSLPVLNKALMKRLQKVK